MMNVETCVNVAAKALYADLREKIRAMFVVKFGQAQNAQQQIDVLMQTIDEAIKQANVAAATLPVQAGGGMAIPQQNFAGAPALNQGYNPMQGQQPVFQQNIGNQMAPAAAQAGFASSLRDVGLPGQTCQVPAMQGQQMPQGCKCGFEQKSAGTTGFCTSPASKVGISGYWCCSKHTTRKSPALGKGGKKSGPTSGQQTVIPSTQIIQGMRNPVNIPGVMGTAPAGQFAVAGLMQQAPQFIGTNPLAGVGQTHNPAQSMQLMNNMATAASQIPGVTPMTYPQVNLNGMLGMPAPTSVGISQYPGLPTLSNIPGVSNLQQPIQSRTIQEEDDDNSPEDSDDEGSQGSNSGSNPLTFQPQAQIQAALAAAQVPGGQMGVLNNFMPQVNPLQMPGLSGLPSLGGLPALNNQPIPTNVLPGTGTQGLQNIFQGLGQPAVNPLQPMPALPGIAPNAAPVTNNLAALQSMMNASSNPMPAAQPQVQITQTAPPAEAVPVTEAPK
jgi:hypothetical protein